LEHVRTHARSSSQRGQILPIIAICCVLVVILVGLGIDGGVDRSIRTSVQTASDASGEAAANAWGATDPTAAPAALSVNSTATPTASYATEAEQIASLNGVKVNGGNGDGCSLSGTQFDYIYYDVPTAGSNCSTAGAPSGWKYSLEIRIPPTGTIPSACNPNYKCVQVIAAEKTLNFLGGLLGINSSSPSAGSITLIGNNVAQVTTWGSNSYGQDGINDGGDTNIHAVPNQTTIPGVTLTQAAGGEDRSYVVDSLGEVWAWGNGDFGQLGNDCDPNGGTPACNLVYSTPTRVCAASLSIDQSCSSGPYLTNIVALTHGHENELALSSSGLVYAWGDNSQGALGNGCLTTCNASGNPEPVCAPTITATGTGASCTGANQLGASTPIVAIAGTYETNNFNTTFAAVTSTGIVYTWGDNSLGELGQNTKDTNVHSIAAEVVGIGGTGFLGGITAVAGGEYNFLALGTGGAVDSWGNPQSGNMGNGTNNGESSGPCTTKGCWPYPVEVCGSSAAVCAANPCVPTCGSGSVQLTGIASINLGQLTAFAISSSGVAYAWGNNGSGQECTNSFTSNASPVAIVGPNDTAIFASIKAISAARLDTFIVRQDGTIWGCGDNSEQSNGALGVGNIGPDVPYPVRLLASNTISLGAAGTHVVTVGAAPESALETWGDNTGDELGNGTGPDATNTSPIPDHATPAANSGSGVYSQVVAGASFDLAIDNNGYVWAWGTGTNGQLGDGATSSSNVPVEVVGPADSGYLGGATGPDGVVTQVAIAGTVGMALMSDGTVWTWGTGKRGELGNGTTGTTAQDSPVQVCAVGGTPPTPPATTCATTLSGVVAIGGSYSSATNGGTAYAIDTAGNLYAWGNDADAQLGQNAAGNSSSHSLPNYVLTSSSTDFNLGADCAPAACMIAAGNQYALVMNDVGAVYGFGDNTYDQLGQGPSFTTPVETPTLVNWCTASCTSTGTFTTTDVALAIAAGPEVAGVLDQNSHAWFAGSMNYDEGCDDTTFDGATVADQNYFEEALNSSLAAMPSIDSIAISQDNTYMVDGNGELWSCGRNVESNTNDPIGPCLNGGKPYTGCDYGSMGLGVVSQGTPTDGSNIYPTATPTLLAAGVYQGWYGIAAGGQNLVALVDTSAHPIVNSALPEGVG
jgi:alpha-tubulin suppressor-like RCC1 family protein